MTLIDTDLKAFRPGSMGWTAADLDEPSIEAQWEAGRFEIVEGVLAAMPPAFYFGNKRFEELITVLNLHTRQSRIKGHFAHEVDIVISEPRVARADAVFMTPEDESRQIEAARKHGKLDPERTRIFVPPTLVLESISP